MTRHRFAAVTGAAMLIALVGTGCDTKATKDRLAQAEGQLTQMQTVSAEKDSLLSIVAENTKLMSEIGTELTKVRDVRGRAPAGQTAEETAVTSAAYRERLSARIKDIVARVNTAESRLGVAQRKADSLGTQYSQTLADLQTALDNQKQTVASLQDQVAGLEQERTTLMAQNDTLQQTKTTLTTQGAALADTLHQVDTENNRVYYVIGTKEDLKSKGILAEEGSKFLFFGSKSLVPARTLDPSAFTAIDRRQLSSIPLPDPNQEYKIVSRQNLMFLGEQPAKDGTVKGQSALHITEPEGFWAPSPYLIIVQS